MSILKGFDFSNFESPDFKEDSVREEIIQPILTALGYKASGKLKIVRSRKLVDLYVQIGSQKKKINHFPDYLLEVDGKPYFVLDAKGINEDILSGKNVNQARYYAIHHEVRVDYYGLCNGKQFTVFHVSETEPQLILNIVDIDDKIQELAAYLLPDADQRNLTTDKHKKKNGATLEDI